MSLQKQITGYEVSVGVFNFFGDTLVEINAGTKNQEPLQLGVRTVLELGTLELVSTVARVPFEICLDGARDTQTLIAGEKNASKHENIAAAPKAPNPAVPKPGPAARNSIAMKDDAANSAKEEHAAGTSIGGSTEPVQVTRSSIGPVSDDSPQSRQQQLNETVAGVKPTIWDQSTALDPLRITTEKSNAPLSGQAQDNQPQSGSE